MIEKKGASDVVTPGRLTLAGAQGLEVVLARTVYEAVSAVSPATEGAAVHDAEQRFMALSDRETCT